MRVEVLGRFERRRRWSQDDKARIVEETLVPGEGDGSRSPQRRRGHPGVHLTAPSADSREA